MATKTHKKEKQKGGTHQIPRYTKHNSHHIKSTKTKRETAQTIGGPLQERKAGCRRGKRNLKRRGKPFGKEAHGDPGPVNNVSSLGE